MSARCSFLTLDRDEQTRPEFYPQMLQEARGRQGDARSRRLFRRGLRSGVAWPGETIEVAPPDAGPISTI